MPLSRQILERARSEEPSDDAVRFGWGRTSGDECAGAVEAIAGAYQSLFADGSTWLRERLGVTAADPAGTLGVLEVVVRSMRQIGVVEVEQTLVDGWFREVTAWRWAR